MTDAVVDTSTATPPAPASDVGDVELAAQLDAIIAAAPQEAAPAAKPATGQAPPVGTTPAATTPPADAVAVPDDEEARLLERARQRQAERRQREPYEVMQRELAEVKAQLQRAPGLTSISKAVADGDPAALGAALRAAGIDPGKLQQLATKAQMGPTQADQIRAAVQDVLAPVIETLKPAKAAPQQPAEVDREAVIESYVGYIEGAAERFPLQAELGEYAPHAAMAWIQRKFYAGGADPETIAEVSSLTHEQVASMFEKELRRQRAARSAPSGAPTIASGEQQSQPSGAPSASGGPNLTTSAPRSITNGHAAAAARSLPRTTKEVDADLARELEEIRRAAV